MPFKKQTLPAGDAYSYRFLSKMKEFRLQGMSLLETSLVLAIFGVVATCSLPLIRQQMSNSQQRMLDEKLNAAFDALAVYYHIHARLPYPTEASQDGIAPLSIATSQNIYRGTLPYRTLGLGRQNASDLSGQPFEYIVQKEFTLGQNLIQAPLSAPLIVKDQYGQPVTTDLKNSVAVVLIARRQPLQSHTPNSTLEEETLSTSTIFHDRPTAAQNAVIPYRLRVGWRTLGGLIGPEAYYKRMARAQSADPKGLEPQKSINQDKPSLSPLKPHGHEAPEDIEDFSEGEDF